VIALIPSVHLEPTEIIATARQLSLILVGAIILSSVRMLLRGVARVRLEVVSMQSHISDCPLATTYHRS
jgi:hypothetical protein